MRARGRCDMPALVRSDTTSGDGSLAGDYTAKTMELLCKRLTSFIGKRVTWIHQKHATKPGTSRLASVLAGWHAAVLCSPQLGRPCQRRSDQSRRPSRTAALGQRPGDVHEDDCRYTLTLGCCLQGVAAVDRCTDGRLSIAGGRAQPAPACTPGLHSDPDAARVWSRSFNDSQWPWSAFSTTAPIPPTGLARKILSRAAGRGLWLQSRPAQRKPNAGNERHVPPSHCSSKQRRTPTNAR